MTPIQLCLDKRRLIITRREHRVLKDFPNYYQISKLVHHHRIWEATPHDYLTYTQIRHLLCQYPLYQMLYLITVEIKALVLHIQILVT